MVIARLALLIVLVACRSKAELGASCKHGFHCESDFCGFGTCTTGETGAVCDFDMDCESPLQCYGRQCRPIGRQGDACSLRGDCTLGLSCVEDRCVPPGLFEATRREARARDHALREAGARVRQQAEREKEARLLAESGVAVTAEREPITPAPGSGARVRVVTTTAKGTAFAACRADERLVGGGCKPAGSSYPSGHGEEDTVGARWNCETNGRSEITAHALCSKL